MQIIRDFNSLYQNFSGFIIRISWEHTHICKRSYLQSQVSLLILWKNPSNSAKTTKKWTSTSLVPPKEQFAKNWKQHGLLYIQLYVNKKNLRQHYIVQEGCTNIIPELNTLWSERLIWAPKQQQKNRWRSLRHQVPNYLQLPLRRTLNSLKTESESIEVAITQPWPESHRKFVTWPGKACLNKEVIHLTNIGSDRSYCQKVLQCEKLTEAIKRQRHKNTNKKMLHF